MTHLCVVTCNRFGVLARIATIISASGVNIESATVCPIGGSQLSEVRLRIDACAVQTERLRRKLLRLVDVVEVQAGVAELRA